MSPIRIGIAHNHDTFREKVRRILDDQRDFSVVGEAATGREALEVARNLKPDVLLLDSQLPDMSGIRILQQLQNGYSPSTIVLVSDVNDLDVVEPLRLGAKGFLPKDFTPDLLFKCI